MALLGSLFGILGGVTAIVKKWMGMKERKEFRDAGRNEEILRNLEGNVEAVKELKEIERETDRATDDDRRSNLRRFVRRKSGSDNNG